ncbi:MAG: TetR/AcrR family transcriptional regulator [Verrucomicrobiota bacterium]
MAQISELYSSKFIPDFLEGKMPQNPIQERGRPRGFDEEEILHNLVLLFWEKGYEATTQQDMMERTGLSSSSLLNTFGNKPDLFQRVMDAYASMQRQALEPLLKGEKGIADLDTFLDGVQEHVRGERGVPRGCLAVKTMTGPAPTAENSAEQLKRYQDNLTFALKQTLDRAVELDEVSSKDVHRNVRLLSSSLIGILAVAESSPLVAEETVRALQSSVQNWRDSSR